MTKSLFSSKWIWPTQHLEGNTCPIPLWRPSPPLFFFNGEAVNIHLYSGYNSSKKLLFWKNSSSLGQAVLFIPWVARQLGRPEESPRLVVPLLNFGLVPKNWQKGSANGKHTSGLILLLISAFMLTRNLSLCLFVAFINRFISNVGLVVGAMWPRCAITCNTGRSNSGRRPVCPMSDGVLFIISLATSLISWICSNVNVYW